MPLRYARVTDLACFVRHTGPTSLPGQAPPLPLGETLVCLHGAGGNQGVFGGFIDAIEDRHSVVAFDQPGHGRSGSLDSLASIESLAKFTRELVGALGIERPVLFGHSMGGSIALKYAESWPGDLRALVLSGAPTRATDMGAAIENTRRIAEGKARRAFVREMYAPDTPPETLQKGFMEDLKTDPRALLGDFIGMSEWPGAEDLSAIGVPTLLLRGDHEFSFLAEMIDAAAKEIPAARLVVIPGAAHKSLIEQPVAIAEAVAEFLAGLTP